MIEKTGTNPIILTASGFSASITMNANDAMVFVDIENLSDVPPGHRLEILQELAIYLKEEIGGKIIINIPASALADAEKAGLSVHTQKIEMVDIETLQVAVASCNDKPHVQKSLATYRLVQDDKSVAHSKKLYLFKSMLGNATFVTLDKQKQGLYSPEAEWLKSNNSFVKQFSLHDKEGAMVATLMVAFDNKRKMVYVSDFIAHKDKRDIKGDHSSGIAQAAICQVFTTLRKEHPQIEKVCFIEGVDDSVKKAQERLYGEILHSKAATALNPTSVNPTIAIFWPPKKLLLEAANRSLDSKSVPHHQQCRLSPTEYFEAELSELNQREIKRTSLVGNKSLTFQPAKVKVMEEEDVGKLGLKVLQEAMKIK